MKPPSTVALVLCFAAIIHLPSASGQVQVLDIFDNDAAEQADGVQIVNGQLVFGGGKSAGKPAPPDPAGAHLLELTDGSHLHGTLSSLGRSDLVWQRADTADPLTFPPQDVQRILLPRSGTGSKSSGNAALKLQGGDWLTGDLTSFEKGKFLLAVEGAGVVEIDRAHVEWLHLSKSGPPDTYEGPFGPMGLAGWDTSGGAWDYADGSLAARSASALTRTFQILPDRLDLQFSASDGGNAIRGLTLWLQPAGKQRGYTKGSIYLRFQGNNVSVNAYDGNNMKNLSANVPGEKKPVKETRYRILHDRRGGKLIIFINGAKVADWALQPIKDISPGGSFSWQPNYWSSNLAWTLSKIRLRPWDGSTEPDPVPGEAGKDILTTGAAARQAGVLESITRETVKFGGNTLARDGEPIFIRLATAAAADPTAGAVARVTLAQRGEFDVTGLGVRDGQLKVRTSFGGDLALPLAAVNSIGFPHRLAATDRAAAENGDTLIFSNGDELRGTLLAATHARTVKWKPVKGDRPVEFISGRIAGILFARKSKPPIATSAVRFRNGDWLQGELQKLDRTHLVFRSALAESQRLDRTAIGALYFGQGGEVPVWTGASDAQSWMKGISSEGRRAQRSGTTDRPPAWRYLDGSFTLPFAGSGGRGFGWGGDGNGPNIGRSLDNLPDKVEISFDLATSAGPAGYTIGLFSDENRPGLMIQGGWDSAYIYDMSPRKQGAFMIQPQQVDFGATIGSEGDRRSFRFLGDRKTGRLVMLVNGIPVSSFGRAGRESPKPGRSIAITPQQMNSRATISNLWIGPWTGDFPVVKQQPKAEPRPTARNGQQPPSTAKPQPESRATKDDTIALVNGDETSGSIESATAAGLNLNCDAGVLEIPLSRALMVEFAGTPTPPAEGVRLHLAGKGTITVDTLAVADGRVTCHSATAGHLAFAAEALSEIVFQLRNIPPPSPVTSDISTPALHSLNISSHIEGL